MAASVYAQSGRAMPLTFSDHTLPSGEPYLRMESRDQLELSDCEALAARLDRPEYRMGKAVSVVNKGTRGSAEVRRTLNGLGYKYSAVATVVTSPILRAMVSMMSRLAPAQHNHRIFADENAAIAWLDQQPSLDPPG